MENLNIFVRFVRFVLGFKFNLSHEIRKNQISGDLMTPLIFLV